MTSRSRTFLLRLGVTSRGEPVPLHIDGRGVGLLVVGEHLSVLALARTLIVQLATQCSDPVLVRADDRITVGGVPLVALLTGASGVPPPPGETPQLTIDDIPWAQLEGADGSVRVRCTLTARAEFPALLAEAGMRAPRQRGRHARAEENGGSFAPSALIS